MIEAYEGLCIITYINEDGSLEPVSDKGDFIPDRRRSLPVKLYNDKKWAKKKIQMYIKHAEQYLNKWKKDSPDVPLIEASRTRFEKEMIHDIRYRLQMVMLGEDGDSIRGDAYSRAYRCFRILNVSEIFNMDYVNKYMATKFMQLDEIKTMTLDEQVEEFGTRHKIINTTILSKKNPNKFDYLVEYENEDYTGDHNLLDDRCVIAYLRDDGELEPISDKGQFVFIDHKAQQFRIYRNPQMAMRKINMFVDHAYEYVAKYDYRMDKYAKKCGWAHGKRPKTLMEIIVDKDEKKLVHKTRFNLMRDMLDESGDKIREDAKEVAYKKIMIIPIAPLLEIKEKK